MIYTTYRTAIWQYYRSKVLARSINSSFRFVKSLHDTVRLFVVVIESFIPNFNLYRFPNTLNLRTANLSKKFKTKLCYCSIILPKMDF